MQGPRLPSHTVDASPIAHGLKSPSPTADATAPQRRRADSTGRLEKLRAKMMEAWVPAWSRLKRHGAFVGARHLMLSRKRLASLIMSLVGAGPGVIASVAYIDPGNWATDLQAGSQFGYALLFIVLLSGLIALLFQILSCRLGSVTGLDLAQHCRQEMHDRPRHKMLWRWAALYPLYIIAEIGIIFTDLAELLGSAIAINLLIPALPLWSCVLLTSLDVLLILLMFNNYPTKMVTRSMRIFELLIGLLVLCVLASFVTLLVRVSPVWKDVFKGYVPGPGIVRGGGLYVSVGILGATAMPHAFFIGSKMATMRRLAPSQYGEVATPEQTRALAEERDRPRVRLHLPQPVRFAYPPQSSPQTRAVSISENEEAGAGGETTEEKDLKDSREDAPERPTLRCVKAHLGHAVIDIAGSLLGFAILINSSILILSAAVFYYGDGKSTSGTGVSDLFDAYDLVRQYVGPAFAYLFAIGLLAAGQSASLTVTLAGQIISEGFLNWRTKPWKRRVITRLIGIVPSLAVAAAVGRDGLDVLLVGSQVALSIVLPFVMIPLIMYTTSHRVMSLPVDDSMPATPSRPANSLQAWARLNPFRRRRGAEGYVSFANGTLVVYLCWLLWVVITAANVYALYELASGAS